MDMHPHTKYHWPISKQKFYGPGKKILFKKQLFYLEVKGQGPTKVITVRDTPPYGHAQTNYLPMHSFVGFIWIIWLWGQRSRSHEGHYSMQHPRLMVMHQHTNYHWPISKDKNVMARIRKYYSKNKYLTLRSKSHEGHYVRDTPPYGHAHINYLPMNSCVGFIWIIWPWGQRSRSHEGHYGTWHTTLWSCTYELSSNEQLCWIYLTLRSKVKVPQRSLWYATHRFMVMHAHTNYHWPTSKDKNSIARTRKYYLKNNYLTLRSKMKVPWRSLRYATHRLMVMHPHAKYHWPISKDKKVMVRTSFAEKKKQKRKKKYQTKTICLPSFEGET
jgi:acyl-CoA thioesterase FadM